MIYYLFYPTNFILSILFSSSITAFFICKLNNKSFFNAKLYSHNYLINKINTVAIVATNIIINYNIIYFTSSQFFLHEKIETIDIRIIRNIQFIFLLEFIAYIYHRFSHELVFLYKNKHSIHHKNIEVYPIDFLEFDIVDNIAQTLYINLPLLSVPMNHYDYAIIYYIYSTCAFIIHSDILTDHHIIHHKYFKCNYSLMLPVFDIIFGTYSSYIEDINSI